MKKRQRDTTSSPRQGFELRESKQCRHAAHTVCNRKENDMFLVY